ncbi:hypothetical protein P7K49_012271, partial [Saguinus oedipus]
MPTHKRGRCGASGPRRAPPGPCGPPRPRAQPMGTGPALPGAPSLELRLRLVPAPAAPRPRPSHGVLRGRLR